MIIEWRIGKIGGRFDGGKSRVEVWDGIERRGRKKEGDQYSKLIS